VKIHDALILATDRAVSAAYGGGVLDRDTATLFATPDLPTLNMGGISEAPFRVLKGMEDRFYCFAGSSNFHHLDAVNIQRLSARFGSPLQVVLIDQHMDCVRFDENDDLLHCGNWVSYCFRKGWLSKIAMIGCRDQRSQSNFDGRLEKEGALAFFPDPARTPLGGFLNPGRPVYLSVDTDVLSVPGDWSPGLHSLDSILKSPVWDFLAKAEWVGAFLHGHVTDNRRFLDILRSMSSGHIPNTWKNLLKDLGVNLAHAFWPKLRASFFPALPMDEQLKIMLAIYARAEKTRRG
jgi:hypothetical protein